MNNLPPMTLLDYMVSTKENNMLKAFLPFVDREFQPLLATYIKFSELLATIDLFKRGGNVFGSHQKSSDFTDIFNSILPYASPQEREAFDTISNLKNTLEMFEMYKDMMSDDSMSDMMSDMMSNMSASETTDSESFESSSFESSSTETDSSPDTGMADMLSSMLTPEQQLMFQQISGMMNQS